MAFLFGYVFFESIELFPPLTFFHDSSLRLATKARAWKGVVESVIECEGISPHTPKWTPIL